MDDRLTRAEQSWAKGWVRGIANIIGSVPPGEDSIAAAQRAKQIMAMAETSPRVVEYAKKWRNRLLEVLSALW
jgi:hypothetical protein